MSGHNHVSRVLIEMRKNIAKSKDKDVARKELMTEVIDEGLGQILAQIKNRKMKLTLQDFERLVKLKLLLDGDATEIIENKDDPYKLTPEMKEVLQSDEFETISNKLYEMMNAENES